MTTIKSLAKKIMIILEEMFRPMRVEIYGAD